MYVLNILYHFLENMSIKSLKERIEKTNNNPELLIIKKDIEKKIENRGGKELEDLLTQINIKLKPHLPQTLIDIKTFLLSQTFECYTDKNRDGRVNSCLDEDKIINMLINNPSFANKIVKPELRNWYDIKVLDDEFGYIPVNIKTTTMKTADNVGNMSICLQSLTDHTLDIDGKYNNGDTTTKFLSKCKNKEYNKDFRKDYYFLVINKNNTKDIIVNSVLGVSNITPNVNNLPFQIKWNNNKNYDLTNVEDKVLHHLKVIKKNAKQTWQERLLSGMRELSLE